MLADLLFWDQRVGLSLAVFAAATFAVGAFGSGSRQRVARAACLLLFGTLPVVEHVQALSLAFLSAALLAALVYSRIDHPTPARLIAASLRLLRRLPFGGLAALVAKGRALWSGVSPVGLGGPLRLSLRNWALPVGGTLVFGALLLDANPLLERMLTLEVDLAALVRRGLFWTGTALVVWPLIDTAPVQDRPMALPHLPVSSNLGVNAGSTLRALWMFNLLIGVQTVLDLSILIGGAALPPGMTYAAYAHRGAYPLLATALLAGAFALAARPFLDEHRAVKPLLLLWLGQNVLLCLSALLRLDLYVDAFGLTYLRVHAMIWMALVAAGLALTGWQVWRARTNGWLMVRCATLGFGTLYLCAFVNFAHVIAERNLASGRTTDWDYLCSLPDTAAGAFHGGTVDDRYLPVIAAKAKCTLAPPRTFGWRDWGFRNWRVARYVAEVKAGDPRE